MERNYDVGGMIRHIRNNSKLSVDEISEKLKELGYEKVSKSTIYGYENRVAMPNADVFLDICVICGCENPMKYWDKEQLALSTDEKNLVKKYRELDEETQSDIIADITRKYDRIMDRKKENITKTA